MAKNCFAVMMEWVNNQQEGADTDLGETQPASGARDLEISRSRHRQHLSLVHFRVRRVEKTKCAEMPIDGIKQQTLTSRFLRRSNSSFG